MTENSCDILAIGAHPDDVELNVGGTLLIAKAAGLKTKICHLTSGELGTRGSRELRQEEAQRAARLLSSTEADFLELPDGGVECNRETKSRVVNAIRKYRPRIIMAPYWTDLHPDHAATGRAVKESNFLSGLANWEPKQAPWRADVILYYMSHTPIDPAIVVDISHVFEEKKKVAQCYASQFFAKDSEEPKTFISGEGFWDWWEGRASYWGHLIGVTHGEPFFIDGPIPLSHPFDLFRGFGKYKNP